MEKRKNKVLIKVKLAILFGLITLLIFGCFALLHQTDRHVRADRDILYAYGEINHSFFKIESSFWRIDARKDNSKKDFVEELDLFETSLVELFKERMSEDLDSLLGQDHIHAEDFDDRLSEEQAVILRSYEFWTELKHISDKIKFSNLNTDSLVIEYEPNTIFIPADSSSREIVEKKTHTTKVFTQEAKHLFFSFELFLGRLEKEIQHLDIIYKRNLHQSSIIANALSWLIFLIVFGFMIAAFFFSKLLVIAPLEQISIKTERILEGNLETRIPYTQDNEIGIISRAVNSLVDDIQQATLFIQEIKSGNLNHEIIPSETEDNHANPLESALLSMRDQLRNIAEKEKERNWTIEGQAILSEVLSKNYNDFQVLVDEVISQLVRYLEARQGGLFVISDSEAVIDVDKYLELVSWYAFDRKKFINKRITLGEGLVGQVWQEEKTIYLEHVPEDHTIIKSGLGEAQPLSLLIVPLIDNGIIYGVVEIASFKQIEPYQIEFVEKIGETIASTLSSVEVNNKTQKLLIESQNLTEKMKEQEDLMLQNLEKLQSTQEDIQRREFQKDNELKLFTEKFDNEVSQFEEKEKEYTETIESLKEAVEKAKTDNSAIRELTAKVDTLEKETNDLAETVKIKDMRIDKMRKKIEKLTGN